MNSAQVMSAVWLIVGVVALFALDARPNMVAVVCAGVGVILGELGAIRQRTDR